VSVLYPLTDRIIPPDLGEVFGNSLRSLFASHERKSVHLHASSIYGCPRAEIYRLRGVEPEEKNTNSVWVMMGGQKAEEVIVDALQLFPDGFRVKLTQAYLLDGFTQTAGRIDLVLEDEDGNSFPVELKSTSVQAIKNLEYRKEYFHKSHAGQLLWYYYMCRDEHCWDRCALFYVSREKWFNLTIFFFPEEYILVKTAGGWLELKFPDELKEKAIFANRKMVYEHWLNDTLPNPLPEDDWHCKYCGYQKICRGEKCQETV